MLSIVWSGGGNDSLWKNPLNWSGGQLPTAADDVSIPVANLTVTLDTISPTVHSLTSAAGLNITSGSLTVNAPSTIDGELSMNSGTSLVAAGAGASLAANGTTTADAANLSALDGGKLSLPKLTSYAGSDYHGATLQASGSGSVLDLSHVITFSGGYYEVVVQANSGGRVTLGGISTITSGGTSFTANGTDSTIDLSGLTELAHSTMSVSGGGRILGNSGLLSLDYVDLALDGPTSALPTAQLTSFGNGTISVNGAALDLGNLATASGISVNLSGGVTQSLPKLTSYAGASNRSDFLLASGTESVLDLSHMIAFSGSNYGIAVLASSGGRVKLGGISTITSGVTSFTANGTDSTIDLSGLTELAHSTMSVSGGGQILGNSGLLSLDYVDLALDGPTSALPTAQLTSFSNGRISVNGAALDLGNLATTSGISVNVSGGVTQSLPKLTSYVGVSNRSDSLQASGTESVLDLSHMIAFSGSNYGIVVLANSGGRVKLGGISTITSGGTSFTANGSGAYAATTVVPIVAVVPAGKVFKKWAGDSGALANPAAASTNATMPAANITVTAVFNHPPVAVDDAYATNENTTLNVPAPGVLVNDIDVDGDTLTAIQVTTPAHGALTLNANGSLTYVPTRHYHGADSFTYKANDGSADSNTATVILTVNAAPVVESIVSTAFTGTVTVAANWVNFSNLDTDDTNCNDWRSFAVKYDAYLVLCYGEILCPICPVPITDAWLWLVNKKSKQVFVASLEDGGITDARGYCFGGANVGVTFTTFLPYADLEQLTGASFTTSPAVVFALAGTRDKFSSKAAANILKLDGGATLAVVSPLDNPDQLSGVECVDASEMAFVTASFKKSGAKVKPDPYCLGCATSCDTVYATQAAAVVKATKKYFWWTILGEGIVELN